jgi:hypothetical protein
MATGGLGDYQIGEVVYQGYSYATSVATAKVKGWYADTRKLQLTDMKGHFVTGTPIKAVVTNTSWTPSYFDETPTSLVTIQVEPDPYNVILPNNYTYSVQTTEFPNNIP